MVETPWRWSGENQEIVSALVDISDKMKGCPIEELEKAIHNFFEDLHTVAPNMVWREYEDPYKAAVEAQAPRPRPKLTLIPGGKA